MGIHWEVTKNNCYEEAMRVPLLIRYPRILKPRSDDILLSTPDLCPTLLGLMGFASSIPPEVDGTDLTNYLISGKGKKPASQWYMRVDAEKPEYGLRGIRNDIYTFVINQEEGKGKIITLFNRRDDPYELTNIAADNPALVSELTGEVRQWLIKYNDPWLKNIR